MKTIQITNNLNKKLMSGLLSEIKFLPNYKSLSTQKDLAYDYPFKLSLIKE